MTTPRNRLVKALRRWSEKLEAEAAIARHRVEIDNDQKAELLHIASVMDETANFLEKLDGAGTLEP